jgi:DNA invertase Pin-like site-specific DNA recombinase
MGPPSGKRKRSSASPARGLRSISPQYGQRARQERPPGGLKLVGEALEAQKISERTRAGLERARRRGIKIGRPKLEEGLRSQITHRLAAGATPFAVPRALGVDRKTVLKYAGHLPYQRSASSRRSSPRSSYVRGIRYVKYKTLSKGVQLWRSLRL